MRYRVMGDDEDGALELLEGEGEGVERLVVEVVGRLVLPAIVLERVMT